MPVGSISTGPAWSDELLAAFAAQTKEVRWQIESYSATASPGWDTGASWTVVSHLSASAGGARASLVGPPRFEGSSVTPVSWSSSLGGWSFEMQADQNFFANRPRRGTWMECRIGLRGMSVDDFARVAIGVLGSVVRLSATRYRVTVLDPVAGLRSRQTTAKTKVSFAGNLPLTTVATSSFSTGSYPATLTVTSTSDFLDASPHDMALALGAAEEAWFRYTAKTATTFTIAADEYLGSSAPAASYAVGAQVKQVAFWRGHPATILRRVFATTGSGTNGAADVYLETMGVGLPSHLIDGDDIALWEGYRQPSSGSFTVTLGVIEPQVNGLSWLLGHMSTLGFWPVMRHGSISVRAALDPTAVPFEPGLSPYKLITDANIVRVLAHEQWAIDSPVEYAEGRVTSASATSTANLPNGGVLQTRPAQQYHDIDISGLVRNNEAQVRTEVLATTAAWAGIVPARTTLLLGGWQWAELVPGDYVRLSTSRIRPLAEAPDVSYDRKLAMVTSVTPFVGPFTQVTLAIPQTY